MFDTQDAVAAAFADLEHLLEERRPQPAGGACANCGGVSFSRGSNAGQVHCYYDVCNTCGAVVADTYGMADSERYNVRHTSSNYKRIHHWHERISQLLLQESAIPRDDFMQIAERLLDGSHTVINKDVIRGVLRSLNMQLYIEKWLQIIHRVTGIEPPKPGGRLLSMLDQAFIELQQPFAHYKAQGRKNFLNYNYVFCRLFQKLDCTQFCMFFPLIKSKVKLAQLEETYAAMLPSIGWEFTELQPVTPFAVHLERPDLLLQQLGARRVPTIRPAPGIGPWRTAGPMLRPPPAKVRRPKPEPRRSAPPAPAFQKLGLLKKRRH